MSRLVIARPKVCIRIKPELAERQSKESLCQVTAEDSYKRCAVQPELLKIRRAGKIFCTVHLHTHKRTKTVSDNKRAFYFITKRGLPKSECSKELCILILNIRYGNGASVVVRDS